MKGEPRVCERKYHPDAPPPAPGRTEGMGHLPERCTNPWTATSNGGSAGVGVGGAPAQPAACAVREAVPRSCRAQQRRRGGGGVPAGRRSGAGPRRPPPPKALRGRTPSGGGAQQKASSVLPPAPSESTSDRCGSARAFGQWETHTRTDTHIHTTPPELSEMIRKRARAPKAPARDVEPRTPPRAHRDSGREGVRTPSPVCSRCAEEEELRANQAADWAVGGVWTLDCGTCDGRAGPTGPGPGAETHRTARGALPISHRGTPRTEGGRVTGGRHEEDLRE